MPSRVANEKLAGHGKLSYEWAANLMPILQKIKAKNQSGKPLAGFRLGLCLHITKETSVLALAAQSLGAQVALCSANPLSVQDDVAAYLASEGISTFAWRKETRAEYIRCMKRV